MMKETAASGATETTARRLDGAWRFPAGILVGGAFGFPPEQQEMREETL